MQLLRSQLYEIETSKKFAERDKIEAEKRKLSGDHKYETM